jgi:chitinase
MPFDKVSALFVAFAHAYPVNQDPSYGATLKLQTNQHDQAARVKKIMDVARQANPSIKIIISLGWGMNDWTYINADINGIYSQFPQNVTKFVKDNKFDGFDIDDESIGDDPSHCQESSGCITPKNFDLVISALRRLFDEVSTKDRRPYYLTITPAFGTAHVTKDNISNFDLVNCQCYGGTTPSNFDGFGYPTKQISWGIDTEDESVDYPTKDDYQGLAGIFNWTLPVDGKMHDFEYTKKIAHDVGYPPAG